jgi:hypothetical protein
LTMPLPNSLPEAQSRTRTYLRAMQDLHQTRAVRELQILYRIGENLYNHPYDQAVLTEDFGLKFPTVIAASLIFGCFYSYQGAISHIRDVYPEDLYQLLPSEVQQIFDAIQPVQSDLSLDMKVFVSAAFAAND